MREHWEFFDKGPTLEQCRNTYVHGETQAIEPPAVEPTRTRPQDARFAEYMSRGRPASVANAPVFVGRGLTAEEWRDEVE